MGGTGRVATPEIRQGETAECGLAALAILLAHHGRPVTLEQLRAEAGSTRLGLTARTLLHLARRHGMEARAFRKEPEELAALGFPLIAHSRFIHYLVVEGVTRRDVLVNDPATGPRSIPWEEFAENFTGIAITLRPVAPTVPRSGRGRFLRALARHLAPHHGALRAIFAMAALAAAATVVAALAAGALVDGQPGAAPALLAALAVLLGTGWARDRRIATLGARLAEDTAGLVLARLLHRSPGWFARRSAGQIAAAPVIGFAFQESLGAALLLAEAPLTLAPPAVAALAIDGTAGLGPVVTALLGVLALVTVQGRRGAIAARLGPEVPAPVLPDAATLRALDTHRIGGRDAELFGLLAGRHAVGIATTQQAAAAHARLAAFRHGLAAAGLALVLGLGLPGMADGRVSAGDVVALAALSIALHRPLGQLQRWFPELESLKSALHRLDDTEAGALPGDEPAVPPQRPAGRLELVGAGFRPSPLGPPILDGIRLTVEPGQQVTIVGPSGSGKSVLAKLSCGLLECGPGQILLDGHPVAAMARRHPGAVALVDRSSPVGPGTVADTLRLGDAALSDEALRSALDLVGLTADLSPRGGLSLVLSAGGAELSGGQRRRLALARALLRRPALLVLDGVLDALEPDLDRAIRNRLRRLGCTLLVVGSRLGARGEGDRLIDLGAPSPFGNPP
ncbi:cysteine peptidase family C39 domain-containing protein [Azospirillum doebereinerae]|uniref:ATP-binding cassette domain-containing protein n=1 Tax=Azospirillum doebereinerae TaxID=92933 RepID=A0A3S0XIF8_9PROT|nr:cysteine peptidase family C39 domain-containing protein [Azospirillum doebereinerae]RUQ62058.1 ATP-binding cassette domain-containing protein [Azospirillum doebereinerae]